MKIVPTLRTDYAVRAILHLTRHGEGFAKADEIGTAMDIPSPFLRQILGELQRQGIVRSRSGGKGGYALARPATEITLLNVIEGLEGPLDPGRCALSGGPCYWTGVCPLHSAWSSAREAFRDELASATFAMIAEEDRGIESGLRQPPEDSHRT